MIEVLAHVGQSLCKFGAGIKAQTLFGSAKTGRETPVNLPVWCLSLFNFYRMLSGVFHFGGFKRD